MVVVFNRRGATRILLRLSLLSLIVGLSISLCNSKCYMRLTQGLTKKA